jgi:hypothetical protein
VLLAILVLLAATVLAAGCARTDEQGAGGQGATTVTVPPITVPPTTATTPPPSTTPTAAPGPTLVWPYTTAVNVIHSVKVPPVPVLDHVRVGRHAGYDRIVFAFAGPIPAYRVQPVAALFEDASGAPLPPGCPDRTGIGRGDRQEVWSRPREGAAGPAQGLPCRQFGTLGALGCSDRR